MTASEQDPPRKPGKKVRVPMRRNRSKPGRVSDWTQQARDAEGHDLEGARRERIVTKGDLSRQRTIIVHEDSEAGANELPLGTVVELLGLYVNVDDGNHIYSCTVPRMLRTRIIKDRHPVAVGDRVRFRVERSGGSEGGVIESVEPRRGQLQRRVGRRIQTVVANADQAVIVSSADQPPPKPPLIDRYIVSALSGTMTPIICMNKIDLDQGGFAANLLDRYAKLGYEVLRTSATTGEGIDRLRETLKGKSSVVAGQSGVGKSSLLNAVQPGLGLRVGEVTKDTGKGRHTTTTATLIRLDLGGYVVDTPGVRSFELAEIHPGELEAYFVEFVPHVPHCRFPDCTHLHETQCAVLAAVEKGLIHPERYESYVRLYEEGTTEGSHQTR